MNLAGGENVIRQRRGVWLERRVHDANVVIAPTNTVAIRASDAHSERPTFRVEFEHVAHKRIRPVVGRVSVDQNDGMRSSRQAFFAVRLRRGQRLHRTARVVTMEPGIVVAHTHYDSLADELAQGEEIRNVRVL